jgi:hypothetical protein
MESEGTIHQAHSFLILIDGAWRCAMPIESIMYDEGIKLLPIQWQRNLYSLTYSTYWSIASSLRSRLGSRFTA